MHGTIVSFASRTLGGWLSRQRKAYKARELDEAERKAKRQGALTDAQVDVLETHLDVEVPLSPGARRSPTSTTPSKRAPPVRRGVSW